MKDENELRGQFWDFVAGTERFHCATQPPSRIAVVGATAAAAATVAEATTVAVATTVTVATIIMSATQYFF